MASVLLIYALCAAIIFFAGKNLVKYGDAIADHFGLGRVWLGSVLIASATSLPELVTSISAVYIASPLMVSSNIFGSNLFNVFVIGLMLVFFAFPDHRHDKQVSSLASFSLALMCVCSLFIFRPWSASLWKVGLNSMCLVGAYLIFMKLTFKAEAGDPQEEPSIENRPAGLGKNILGYSLCVFLILIGGIGSVYAAEKISVLSGLGEQFVGVLFLALATSLPEVVTSVQASRMGSLNLILGIAFGSNVFNICIFFACDFFERKGPILNQLGHQSLFAAFMAIFLSALVLALLFNERLLKYLNLKMCGLIVILSYLCMLFLSYSVNLS